MENVYLMGSENVQRAGQSMESAAERMANVSMNLQSVLEANQRFMDDWLSRFAEVINKADVQKFPVFIPQAGGLSEWITSDGKSWSNEKAAEKHEGEASR